jgi:predicted alpha-1,6-mannanase (GH76 family)
VFRAEGDGGDEGLFKGIYYRYAELLLRELPADSAAAQRILAFIASSTDALARTAFTDDLMLAGNDWSRPAEGTIAYSTELSAILAVEVRARVEAREFAVQR